MARSKKNENTDSTVISNPIEKDDEITIKQPHIVENTIDMNKKVRVKNNAPWSTGCTRILTVGDIHIQPNGTVNLSREEIIAQVQSGNKLFTGIDGLGSHATLYIDDEWTRKEVEFETDTIEQNVITVEKIKRIFEHKNLNTFKKEMKNLVVTRSEKVFLMEQIKKLMINDYERIVFCEELTGYKV